jgi:ribosomal protein L7/L12
MPTEFQTNKIVETTYKLIKALSDAYGEDHAMKVYDDISIHIGEAKDLLWTKLFSGELITAHTIVEFRLRSWHNKIMAIKAVRRFGMPEEKYNENILNSDTIAFGLKDAKDYVFDMIPNKLYKFVVRNENDMIEFKREMTSAGAIDFL